MNMAGGHELAYASRAILSELMNELISSKALSPDAASGILDRAVVSLQHLGNIVSVPGAITVVKDIRTDLAERGVK
jgi:hypothetical protein